MVEQKISPGLLIVAGGLGLGLVAVVGVAAMARAAPPTPPPEATGIVGKQIKEFGGEWRTFEIPGTIPYGIGGQVAITMENAGAPNVFGLYIEVISPAGVERYDNLTSPTLGTGESFVFETPIVVFDQSGAWEVHVMLYEQVGAGWQLIEEDTYPFDVVAYA